MTKNRIITSNDPEVNRVAREKLGLPEGAPVGFEMLGRPPMIGETWVRGDAPVNLVDMEIQLGSLQEHPANRAFRIVALTPNGEPVQTTGVKETPLCRHGIRRNICTNECANDSGRVRVIQPSKYPRIEARLTHGTFNLGLESEIDAGCLSAPTIIPTVEPRDLLVLAEAFTIAAKEWAKVERSD